MVLAAEPPDISMGATSTACRASARSASISVIEPFTSSCARTKSSRVVGDHVDERVADPHDVEAGWRGRPPLVQHWHGPSR